MDKIKEKWEKLPESTKEIIKLEAIIAIAFICFVGYYQYQHNKKWSD